MFTDPLQRDDVALALLAYQHVLDLEQAKQLASKYLGIERVKLANIVNDHLSYSIPEEKIIIILHGWKTREGDVTAKQLYHYLTKIDLRVSQLEKAREILEIQGIFTFINFDIILLFSLN